MDVDVTFSFRDLDGDGVESVDSITAIANSNSPGAEYHVTFQCLLDGRYITMHPEARKWPQQENSLSSWEIPRSPLRVVATAIDPENPGGNLTRIKVVHVPENLLDETTPSPGCDVYADGHRVFTNYQRAIDRVRATLRVVLAKLASGNSADLEFSRFASTEALFQAILNPEGEEAPGGGLAYVDEAPGVQLDRFGSVGVQISTKPSTADDWCRIDLKFHLPAYPMDLPSIYPETTVISWRDIDPGYDGYGPADSCVR